MNTERRKNKKGLMQRYRDWIEEQRDTPLVKYVFPAGLGAYSAINLVNGYAAYDYNKDFTYSNKKEKEKRLKELMKRHSYARVDFNDYDELDEMYWKKLTEHAADAEDFKEARDIAKFLEEYPTRRVERALGLTLLGTGVLGTGASLGVIGANLYKDIKSKKYKTKKR